MSMTAACGASSPNSAVCTEASWSKPFADFNTAATASAGDLTKFNDATAKLAADLKALAGTADGEVATALTDLATSFESIKIDANDPAAAAGVAGSLATKVQEASTKLVAACA
ncbi:MULTISPECIES: hypothetical protein [unclassified Streptosporangium]|uniref:hypothetical protein n=1 Tax=unclassified Streptosporangium TaxID=2632669 RepID=UPI002E2B7B3A|nr:MULTISPECIES: hypothetical protein [unclassified Streptosporangium]